MGDLNKPGLVRSCKTHECTSVRRGKLVRWSVSAVVLAAGIVVFVVGIHLETSTSRSNMEDILVWSVLAIGAAGIGTGLSLPFARPSGVVLIGLASPFIAYGTAVLVVWAWIVVVEGPQGWRYCRTLDAARSEAPYIPDFVRLFPEAEVRYRYFARGLGRAMTSTSFCTNATSSGCNCRCLSTGGVRQLSDMTNPGSTCGRCRALRGAAYPTIRHVDANSDRQSGGGLSPMMETSRRLAIRWSKTTPWQVSCICSCGNNRQPEP